MTVRSEPDLPREFDAVVPNALTVRLGVDLPIVQAPMAGSSGVDLAVAVARAGGLGSLPAAMLTAEQLVEQVDEFRRGANAAINVNFFCHHEPQVSRRVLEEWSDSLARFDRELGVDRADVRTAPRNPFDEDACRLVERCRPEVVSFHFGLPDPKFVERVRATGAVVMSSATTVAEAVWLEAHGCDVVIAQGAEAGGHRGMFLTEDVAAQPGTIALVPRVVDAVDLPVIAAGGIADGRGIAAGLVLGASGGTDRYGVPAVSRGAHHPGAPARPGPGKRGRHRGDERLHGTAGARSPQPTDRRTRSAVAGRTAVSHRGSGGRAAARRRRGARVG